MRVLFIYYDTASSEPPRIGLGVAYLSAFLKKHGHQTRLCYFRSSKDLDYSISIIDHWKPQIVAHSATSSSYPSTPKVVKAIRAAFPDLFQICGGTHVSLAPEELTRLPQLDAICIGYGEHPMLELVEAIEKGQEPTRIQNLHVRYNGTVTKNSLRAFPADLDPFLPCDRQIFLDELKRFSIPTPFGGMFGDNLQEFIFCRGCPFACTFCCNHALRRLGSGKYIRFPSVSKCVEELVKVKEEMKMTGVAIHDDILTLNKRWFRSFAEEYRENVALPYVCNLRPACFDEDDVRLLRDSGCIVAIVGIESGNDYIRNEVMKKGTRRKDIIAAYEMLHKYGIKTHSQNMIGLPEETAEHFLDTVSINARILPNHATLSVFYPYPGTVLYERCVEENIIDTNRVTGGFLERKDSGLRLPDFPRETLLFYVENFAALIQYEHFSNRNRIIKRLLPLNVGNQVRIIRLMKATQRAKRAMKRVSWGQRGSG